MTPNLGNMARRTRHIERERDGSFYAHRFQELFSNGSGEKLVSLLNELLKRSARWVFEKGMVTNGGEYKMHRVEEVDIDFFQIDCSGISFKTRDGRFIYLDDLTLSSLEWDRTRLLGVSNSYTGGDMFYLLKPELPNSGYSFVPGLSIRKTR